MRVSSYFSIAASSTITLKPNCYQLGFLLLKNPILARTYGAGLLTDRIPILAILIKHCLIFKHLFSLPCDLLNLNISSAIREQ